MRVNLSNFIPFFVFFAIQSLHANETPGPASHAGESAITFDSIVELRSGLAGHRTVLMLRYVIGNGFNHARIEWSEPAFGPINFGGHPNSCWVLNDRNNGRTFIGNIFRGRKNEFAQGAFNHQDVVRTFNQSPITDLATAVNNLNFARASLNREHFRPDGTFIGPEVPGAYSEFSKGSDVGVSILCKGRFQNQINQTYTLNGGSVEGMSVEFDEYARLHLLKNFRRTPDGEIEESNPLVVTKYEGGRVINIKFHPGPFEGRRMPRHIVIANRSTGELMRQAVLFGYERISASEPGAQVEERRTGISQALDVLETNLMTLKTRFWNPAESQITPETRRHIELLKQQINQLDPKVSDPIGRVRLSNFSFYCSLIEYRARSIKGAGNVENAFGQYMNSLAACGYAESLLPAGWSVLVHVSAGYDPEIVDALRERFLERAVTQFEYAAIGQFCSDLRKMGEHGLSADLNLRAAKHSSVAAERRSAVKAALDAMDASLRSTTPASPYEKASRIRLQKTHLQIRADLERMLLQN